MIEPSVKDSVRFFLSEAVTHAQTLPIHKARVFLKGLLTQMGGDTSHEAESLRVIYENLYSAERLMNEQQLELLK